MKNKASITAKAECWKVETALNPIMAIDELSHLQNSFHVCFPRKSRTVAEE